METHKIGEIILVSLHTFDILVPDNVTKAQGSRC